MEEWRNSDDNNEFVFDFWLMFSGIRELFFDGNWFQLKD